MTNEESKGRVSLELERFIPQIGRCVEYTRKSLESMEEIKKSTELTIEGKQTRLSDARKRLDDKVKPLLEGMAEKLDEIYEIEADRTAKMELTDDFKTAVDIVSASKGKIGEKVRQELINKVKGEPLPQKVLSDVFEANGAEPFDIYRPDREFAYLQRSINRIIRDKESRLITDYAVAEHLLNGILEELGSTDRSENTGFIPTNNDIKRSTGQSYFL